MPDIIVVPRNLLLSLKIFHDNESKNDESNWCVLLHHART